MADEETLTHGEILNGGDFYLVLIGGKDETTRVDWDGNVGFPTKEQATDWAKLSACDGTEVMLFRCTPVSHITRGPVRARPYSPPKPKPARS